MMDSHEMREEAQQMLAGADEGRRAEPEQSSGTCPVDCKRSRTPKDECECSCNGKHHGELSQTNDTLDNFLDDFGYQVMDPANADEYGGDVKKVLKVLDRRIIKCVSPNMGECRYHPLTGDRENEDGFVINQDALILGLEGHDGGVRDKDGVGWWIVVICPSCEYQAAWHKILHEYDLSLEGVSDDN